MLLLILVVALAVAVSLAGYAIWVEPNWLRIRTRVLYLHSWDPALEGFTILHLSDLHAGRARSRLERFIKRANDIPADLTVITGDFISGSGAVDDCARILRELTMHREVYAVLGNHEHRFSRYHWPKDGKFRTREPLDARRISESLERSGLKMLTNCSVAIPHGEGSLVLAGIDDLSTPGSDLSGTLRGLEALDSVVLLCHSPDILDDASRLGVPLVLSGHTHGGQVRFPPLGTPTTATSVPLERPYGEIRRQRTVMHVNPGLGTTLLPIRFFARPELTLLELRAATQSKP